VAATSALGIFDRPMEPVDVAATTEAAEPAAPKKTDLEKYLLLAQEPMNTDVLALVEAARSQRGCEPLDRPP
jgi:hypothetical protein